MTLLLAAFLTAQVDGVPPPPGGFLSSKTPLKDASKSGPPFGIGSSQSGGESDKIYVNLSVANQSIAAQSVYDIVPTPEEQDADEEEERADDSSAMVSSAVFTM